MIRRPRGPALPTALSGARSRGGKELAKATAHYRAELARVKKLEPGSKAARVKSFEFKAYGDESVKRALTDLFEGKCAYCESLYASTQPMDVEHFRPKSEIRLDSGETLRPGYWWLAATWENLLPSCIDCNRERGQDELFTDGSRRSTKSGKECRFPLEDETLRARSPRSRRRVEHERPLLLDPCEPDLDPSVHLDFGADGIVRARTRRGTRSIEIYGLNRTELVRARQQVLRFVQHRLYVLGALARLLAPAMGLSADARAIVTDLVDRELDAIRAMRRDGEPFAQMVRQVTDAALARRYQP